jgi:hypothetical protein
LVALLYTSCFTSLVLILFARAQLTQFIPLAAQKDLQHSGTLFQLLAVRTLCASVVALARVARPT